MTLPIKFASHHHPCLRLGTSPIYHHIDIWKVIETSANPLSLTTQKMRYFRHSGGCERTLFFCSHGYTLISFTLVYQYFNFVVRFIFSPFPYFITVLDLENYVRIYLRYLLRLYAGIVIILKLYWRNSVLLRVRIK